MSPVSQNLPRFYPEFTQNLSRNIYVSRLSTIMTADKIVALKDGQVQEVGTHDELMRKEGLYHSLVMAQIASDEEQAERAEEDDVVEDLELVEQSLPSLGKNLCYLSY